MDIDGNIMLNLANIADFQIHFKTES